MKHCYSKNYYQYLILSKKNANKVIELLNLNTRFSTKEEVQAFVDRVGNNAHEYCRYEKGKLIYGSIRHKEYCQDDYGSWCDWYYEEAYEKEIPCNSYILFREDKGKLKFVGAFSKEEFEQKYTPMEHIKKD